MIYQSSIGIKNYQTMIVFFYTVMCFHPSLWIVTKMLKICWRIIKEPWRTLIRLMFLNQIMFSHWVVVEVSKICWTIKEPWRTLTLMFLNQIMHSFWVIMDMSINKKTPFFWPKSFELHVICNYVTSGIFSKFN